MQAAGNWIVSFLRPLDASRAAIVFSEDEYTMEWILELIINSSARRFEQWLMQYIPSSIPDYVDNRDDKPILYIGSPIIINKEENIFVKIMGSPYLKEDSQGLRFYYIDVSVGPLNTIEEEDETKVSIPLLRIFEKTNEKTIVKINLQLVTISLYIKDMTQEIARLWPETKRDISSLEAINWLDMDDILFDFVIETEPQNFMEWIHFELKEMYPGAFTRKIKNIEYLTHIRGDDLPPNTLTSYWEYVIYTHETVFREDINTGKVESYEGFSGAIARIEMRQIVDNRYHVRFLYGEDHPKILEWFDAFKDKLNNVYQPNQYRIEDHSGKNDVKVQSNDNHKGPWLNVDDIGNDRVIVELLCDGFDAETVANRLGITSKTVFNRESELRKRYGTEIVPYRQKWRNRKNRE